MYQKIIIFALMLFLVISYKYNKGVEILDNGISNINMKEKNLDGFEISKEIDKDIFIKTFLTYSSQACYGGDILLEEDGNQKTIFQSREAGNNIFPYCSPSIEKLSEEVAQIFICYQAGGGSGECSAANFEYNINKNIWKYINDGEYSQSSEKKYIVKNIKINNKEITELINYMGKKGYIFQK